MKAYHPIVVLCLAVLPLALARRDLHQSQPLTVVLSGCPAFTCPNQIAWANTRDKSKCGYTMPRQICCGGDTGVKCPSISCGFAYASAISSPGACAYAESMVSTVSYSPTQFNYVAEYAETCFRYLAASEGVVQQAFLTSVGKAATAAGQAVATSMTDAIQYACNKPSIKCKICSSCRNPGAKAVSIVEARGQAVAEMVAVAVAQGFARAFEGQKVRVKGMLGRETDDYTIEYGTDPAGIASGLATAVSKATNVAVVSYTNRVESGSISGTCTERTLKSMCAREVAKAVACAIVKATMLYFGDDGAGNSALVASQCSSASAVASSNRDLELPEMINKCAGVNQAQAAEAGLVTAGAGIPTQDQADKCVCNGNSIPISVDERMHCVPYGLQVQTGGLPKEFVPIDLPFSEVLDSTRFDSLPIPSSLVPPQVLPDGTEIAASLDFEPSVTALTLNTSFTGFWRTGAPNKLRLFELKSTSSVQITLTLPKGCTGFSMRCQPSTQGKWNMRFVGVDSTNGLQTSVSQACTKKTNEAVEAIPFGVSFAGPGEIGQVTISNEGSTSQGMQGLVCGEFVISTTKPAWPKQTDCENTGCRAQL